MKQTIKNYTMPILAVILFSIFPALFLYLNNSSEANFIEIVAPTVFSAVFGIIVFLATFFVIRTPKKSAVIAVILMAIALNFAFFEAGLMLIYNRLYYWHTLPIILFIIAHIVYLIWRYVPEDIADIVVIVLTMVVAGLIIFNIISATPDIIQKFQIEAEKNNENNADATVNITTDSSLPNIYVLVWDEMASFNQMEQHYKYDNVALKEFFEENNFTNSYNSYNEAPSTSTVMTNFINLDYIVSHRDSEIDKKLIRHTESALFDLVASYGYDIKIVDEYNFFGRETVLENTKSEAATMSGENLTDLFNKNLLIYPFLTPNFSDEMEQRLKAIDYVSDPQNIAITSTFTLAHIIFPHEPFLVNENGDRISVDDYHNWENDEIYLGQYIYATKLMTKQLENLIKLDPTALILVMSDHGARSLTTDRDLKCNILNAFYYNGKDLSAYEDKSSVNTIRLLLNEVLGTDMEELEEPYYG